LAASSRRCTDSWRCSPATRNRAGTKYVLLLFESRRAANRAVATRIPRKTGEHECVFFPVKPTRSSSAEHKILLTNRNEGCKATSSHLLILESSWRFHHLMMSTAERHHQRNMTGLALGASRHRMKREAVGYSGKANYHRAHGKERVWKDSILSRFKAP
jgi:hypothetical protein